MNEWAQQLFNGVQSAWLILPAALLLGVAGSVSSCCTLPVVGAVVGYSGSRDKINRGAVLTMGLFFMIGTVIALAALGAVAGFVSQMAGTVLGKYWRLFAGLAAILFGVISLNLFPWRLPNLGRKILPAMPSTLLGASLFGLIVGGGTTTCTAGCNPALASALGLAVLQGKMLWGAGILSAFAIGYSFPPTALMMGVAYGKMSLPNSAKLGMVIRYVSGSLLIGIGFYLLAGSR